MSELNPYQAPAESSASRVPAQGEAASRVLYSPSQVGVATFLGGPLAGSWLIATNYRELDDADQARMTLGVGLVATCLLLGVAFMLPDNFPSSVLPMAYAAVAYQIALQTHGAAVTEHYAAGGRLKSWWLVVGVGLLASVLTVGVVLGLVLLFSA